MLEVTFQIKDIFLDRANVQRKVGLARARVLRRQGSFVRTRARSRMRRRKRAATPGSPPSVHSNAPDYLKNILYGYDAQTDSVVVGPVRLNGRSGLFANRSQTVPNLHEFGGSASILEVWNFGRWERFDGRRRAHKGKRTRTRRATYRPRPFMQPALQAEIDAGTIPTAWADAVRG